MNQVKTGKFINTLRREKGFTQLASGKEELDYPMYH